MKAEPPRPKYSVAVQAVDGYLSDMEAVGTYERLRASGLLPDGALAAVDLAIESKMANVQRRVATMKSIGGGS